MSQMSHNSSTGNENNHNRNESKPSYNVQTASKEKQTAVIPVSSENESITTINLLWPILNMRKKHKRLP